MSRFSLFFIVTFSLSSICSAQDTIVKKNNDTLIVEIENSTGYWVRFKYFHFLDGPYRSISKRSIKKIIYDHNKPSNAKTYYSATDSIFKSRKDPLVGKGVYFEIMPGYSHLYKVGQTSRGDYVGGSVRIGNKRYFGRNNSSRHGINLSWFKIGLYANNTRSNFMLSILNPGYTGIYKLKKQQAFETTVNIGLGLANNTETIIGVIADHGLNYRKKNLSLGVNYSFMYGSEFTFIGWGGTSDYKNGIIHTYSLTFGFKF